MMVLKLVKVKSYFGAVRVTQKNPVVEVSNALGEELLKTKYFSLVSTVEDKDEENISVDKMTLEQLKAVAEQMGIETTTLKKKADFIAAIGAAGAAEETGSEIDLEQA